MERYLVFCGDTRYPEGGVSDLAADVVSLEDATNLLDELDFDWADVLDTNSGQTWHWDKLVGGLRAGH